MNEYIIIANGPDRTGIVSELSKIITKNGGNIKESSMAKLAGDFAIIMLIETNISKTNIEESLSTLNLSLSIKNATKDTKNIPDGVEKIIHLSGTDNEGLVYSLTDFLSQHNINIQNLITEIVQAPITGINLFSIKATITIPNSISVTILEEKICILEHSLEVDIKLIDI